MGRFGRMLRFVFLLVLALLLVDLIYGYVMGQPTAQYIEIGLHVIAVILVFGLNLRARGSFLRFTLHRSVYHPKNHERVLWIAAHTVPVVSRH